MTNAVCGVIAEYDPFHLGHAHHLSEARQQSGAACVISVMSMQFTQRGTPGLLTPHSRARMALENGADIVLGLPVAFSVRDAEHFALSGVSILKACGVVTHLSFGIEPEGQPFYEAAAELLEHPTDAFTALLHEELSAGNGFASACGKSLSNCLHADPSAFSGPNTALAICYARACRRLNASFSLCPVVRESDYHSKQLSDTTLPSASAVRQAILNRDIESAAAAMPSTAAAVLFEELSAGRLHPPEALTPLLRLSIRSNPLRKNLPECSEGLQNRLKSAADELTRDSMIAACKTRRYTWTRISRLLTHVLLDTEAEKLPALPPYAYLLGFRRSAAQTLRNIHTAGLPLAGSLSDVTDPVCAALDKRADDLWSLGAGLPFGGLYRCRPVIIDD